MKLSDELVKVVLEQLDIFTRRAAQWADHGTRRVVVQRLVTGSPRAKEMVAVFDSFQAAVQTGGHLRLTLERLLGGRSVTELQGEELVAMNATLDSIHQLLKAVEAAVLLASETSEAP